MNSLFSRLIAVVASFFIFSAAWFCLWSISLHLVERPELAVLLFPFGLRLGLMLQCPRGYWPVLLGAEWLMLIWLAQEVALAHLPLLMTGSLLTLIPVALISRYRHQRDWRTLLRQGAALIAAALLQSLPWVGEKEGLNALLLTLTGGLTLAPTCLVIWHYLTSTVWQPLGPALVSQPVNWRARHLIWYLLLFVVSLWLQLGLPAELSRFTPFCLALPIIALAWHYGWQGALIATLMNAIALIASQTWHDHPVDLLLSLLAQSLTGLLLGAGIQRLRELNQSLQAELARNRRLAERLLETEESVRQEVARELHDDIGQTITAIRTQAGIVQRLAAENAGVKQGGAHIEQLSLGVYDSVRRLLGRLRPRQLDDLSLEQAIRSLMREMELESRGIVSHLDWRINEPALSEGQRVTLFRVCQEGLNNIVKHASASAVTIQGWQQDERLMLVIEDDGCGLPPGSGQQGFGLAGMRERVKALGGTLTISCTHGTRVSVSLPYPDYHLARLRAVLLHPQKLQRRRAGNSRQRRDDAHRYWPAGDAVLHHLRPVEVLLRHRQRPLQRALFYGRRADRHRGGEHPVWLLHLAVGLCPALGAERLFPGLGRAGLRPPAHRLVLTQRARRLVGDMEYRA